MFSLLIFCLLAATFELHAKVISKGFCSKAALDHIRMHPSSGRILGRGDNLPELSRLEELHGSGRWFKAVYRRVDKCSQTCALVQYFWEKKSGKVVETKLLEDFAAPKPCLPQKKGAPKMGKSKPTTGKTKTEEESFYSILGVKKTATKKDIKKAYRKLAMRWHPDKNRDKKEESELMFKKISEAYKVLFDDTKRKEYDEFGKAGAQGQPQGHPQGAGQPQPFPPGGFPGMFEGNGKSNQQGFFHFNMNTNTGSGRPRGKPKAGPQKRGGSQSNPRPKSQKQKGPQNSRGRPFTNMKGAGPSKRT